MEYVYIGDNMFKKILLLIKKVIVSVLLIYAFNKIAISLSLFIPINVFTVLLVLCGGIPSIMMLALYSYMFI